MKYQPKVGDVLNFSWSGFFGFMIKLRSYIQYGGIFNQEKREKNRWTHTAIVGEVQGDIVYVYEAISKGFTKNKYSVNELNTYIKNKNMKVGRTKIPLKDVKKYCEKYKGRPYGYHQIAIIGYAVFGNTILKNFSTAKFLICSEAVARILYDASNKKINFEKEFNKRYDYIKPIDLSYSKHLNWEK